jgi:hypothetical protein
MELTLNWEIDLAVGDDDNGKASMRQHIIAAAMCALDIMRDPCSSATVFTCCQTTVDVEFLNDPKIRERLSFNGDVWFWSLTRKDSRKLGSYATARRTYKQLFPKLMLSLQKLADSLGGDIAVIDTDGNEVTTVYTKEKK